MGAEVVSRMHGLPLAKALVSSTMEDKDNINILTSSDACVETRDDKCTTDTNGGCYEFRKDDDSDVIDDTEDNDTISDHDEMKQQQQLMSMLPLVLSPLNAPFIDKNIATFVIIPTLAVMFYNSFGALLIETQGEADFTAITASLLASSSHLLHSYTEVLEIFPLLTKSLTTAIIQFSGDFMAQRYEQHQEKDATTIHSNKAYDLRRGLSLFADGLVLSGPLMHYCYEWMEQVWPTSEVEAGVGLARLFTSLRHVFFNDYIIDTTYIALSFIMTGFFEGYSWKEIVKNIRKDFGATVRASWLTSLGLIPVEILCFGYLSLSFRVLAMNFVDLLWGAIVSFYSHRSRIEDSKVQSDEVSTTEQPYEVDSHTRQ
mmetsp:Transcript_12102/g.28706  ORF Transcript_12102/g.28706 Transcript_12102/m.28706 type:complete len:372 (+) Transcript_12102:135-1250(+)